MNDYKEYKAITKADVYQGTLVSFRIIESQNQGPLTECSLNELKATHAHIFQDFPQAWFNEEVSSFFDELPESYLTFVPGSFREPSEHYNPWMKLRNYEHTDIYTFYSCANNSEANNIDDYLRSINISELALKPLSEKISKISEIYQKLDFFHPFQDGNSRTNRLFTARLAQSIGMKLSWDKVASQDLYAARDLNLLAEASEYYKGNDEVEMLIDSGLRVLKERNSQSLNQLLVSSEAVKEMTDLKQEYVQKQNYRNSAEIDGPDF